MKSRGASVNSAPLTSSWRTSADSSPGKPAATWNGARGVWETFSESIFCGHAVPFSATFPRSGMMRSGVLYELPTQAHRTSGTGFSSSRGLLPAPRADGGRDEEAGSWLARNAELARTRPKGASGIPLDTLVQLPPTPTAQLNEPAPWKPGVDWWLQSRATRNLEGVVTGNTPLLPTPVQRDWKGVPGDGVQLASLPREVSLLPTPNTMDDLPPKTREQIQAHRDEGRGGDRNLREAVLYELNDPLLPTPNTMDSLAPRSAEEVLARSRSNGDHGGSPRNLRETVVNELDSPAEPVSPWGRYDAAIKRWEQILGCPAPEPTEPGKDGKLRLNPELPEWMMGLPEGWVTGVPDLSRKEQLHAIGNGCVPAQVALALRVMLDRMHEGSEMAPELV